MKNKKMLVLLSLVLVFSLFAVGCGPADDVPADDVPADDKPAEVRDTLIVGQGADARTLDPHATNDQPSARVMKQIYETLVKQNEAMELVPGLALSWEKIDELTFEFKLRQGVKFHNGEPFNAHEVKFTLIRATESGTIGHIVGAIDPEGIEIIDNYTIRIATKKPFAPLLSHLAHNAAAMLNEKAVVEAGEDYGQMPVGTGPFKLYKWNTGDSVELVRFDGFHGEAPKLRKIIMRNIPEGTNRAIEVETGAIDIAFDIAPMDVRRIEENPDLQLFRDPNLSTAYIGFNAAKEPFDDVRVRQAINYAIDMEAIVEAVYLGIGSPAKGPLGENVWASHRGLKPFGFDVERAKELMKEAGLEDGFSTTIWTNENQQRMDIAEIVQNQLQVLNITTEVKVLEWGAYLDGTAAGEHDMFILGWVTVTGDPDYGLFPLFHSSQFGEAGNRTFWSNPRVDELLDLGRVTADPAKRKAAYMEAQEIIRDEAPWVFTWTGESISGARNNVRGFVQHPAGHHSLFRVYFE